ncbi:MAG: acetylglutamate kinase [Spirochaetia bacterium]|jgi:acetylglutamate kinase
MTTIVVKIGGKAAEDRESLGALCDELRDVSREHRLVLVHGGGAEVTSVARRFGIESIFRDGVRQTSPEEMDVVDMVLAGRVNSQLVRLLRARGLDAAGLCGSDGGTFTGVPLGGEGASTRTGEVTRVDARLLLLLLDAGYIPVVCSTSMDAQGSGLNINADSVAFRLAAQLEAASLVFLSDIPGVISDGSVVQALSAQETKRLIERGVIQGGMVPKVTASFDAMEKGVKKVIIGRYESPGSLARMLEGKEGTRLWK